MSTVEQTGWVKSVLAKATALRIGVFGDFCVDAYWTLAADALPVSLETGLPIRRVSRQKYGLGAAGNVAANLIDLGVGRVQAIGVVGADLFGPQLLRMLRARGIDTSGILDLGDDWQTMVYAKPYVAATEKSRFDFGCFNTLSEIAVERLLIALDEAAGICDAVILNQQVASAFVSEAVSSGINRVIAKHPRTRFIADTRDTAAKLRGVTFKLNAHEAARFLGEAVDETQSVSSTQARSFAERMFARTGQPVFITLGHRGLVVADGSGVQEINGIQILEVADPVGAGDTVVAAIAAVLGGGGDAVTAARLANLAASVTVRKIQTTGTASPAEILAAARDTDFIYDPDLAEDPRRARYIDGTEIEIVRPLPADLRIRHAIFDHDGTLSTLREGWELIMQPMMERAVLGPRFKDADAALYRKVQETVRVFIDKTTGIQTLVQMQGLVQLVRQFGFVPADEVLDEHGYKKIYNDDLLAMVVGRVKKLERGELAPVDFQIKNADLLLRRLHKRGVKLYLASGTDEADVKAEAAAMGYADLFDGRIYGATGDVKVEAKKVVLERIMRENSLAGHEFVVFGDGPVEMREARKRDGIAVGLCSDEVRRFSHNPTKRSRLIRGGAGLLIPDFSQIDTLLGLLKLN